MTTFYKFRRNDEIWKASMENNTVVKILMRNVCVSVTQLCLTVCDPIDYSPSGSSVHGISQARILEWVAISFSRGGLPNPGTEPKSPALQADSLPSELWQIAPLHRRFVTLYRRQGSRPSPWKRNAKKQNGCLRRPYK